MAEVSVSTLAGAAAVFNNIARGSFQTREAAAAGNELFAQPENQQKLEALHAQLEPFGQEGEEQIRIIEENQPAANPLAELAAMLGADYDQLPEEGKAQLKQLAPMFGIDPNAAFTPDAPEVAEAKALAVSTAEAALNEINERAAPVFLQLQEAVASILKQVLPEETFAEVAEHVAAHVGEEGLSAGFAANNAPTLAAAFAPRP
ncbi:MAG TPA: hypothetical protein VL625_06820 [Patescibacteria group bacterium]|nr:hypothetical protein [Patescibacteria group bacterium]